MRTIWRVLLRLSIVLLFMGIVLVDVETSVDSDPLVCVDPAEIIDPALGPCNTTTVSVNITDVELLYGLDIQFSWEPAILEYVDHTATIPVEDYPEGVLHEPGFFIKDVVDEAGNIPGAVSPEVRYWVSYACISPAPPFNGNGTLFNMTFHVKGRGECALDIISSALTNKLGHPIPHDVQDGYFRNVPSERLPIADFAWSPVHPVANETVAFDASGSTPSEHIANYTWNFGDETPSVTESDPITTHVYKINGTYTVTLTIADKEGVVSMNMTKSAKLTIYIRYDVAVVDVKPWAERVVVDETVNIDVTFMDNGSRIETFNVTTYYDDTEIETLTVESLLPFTNETLTFTWNTTDVTLGNYTISAQASPVLGETDLADNIFIDGVVRVVSPIHDVGVIDVTPSKTVIGQGYCTAINVTVENQGIVPETFNVTTYYNSNVINYTTVLNLPPSEETTLTFTWNTTGVAKGNYTIKAHITPLPGETDTTDNTLTDGWVIVTIPGDVDGDFDVDLYDVVKICTVYGSEKGDPRYVPNRDINCDGKINIYDLVIACIHYGQEDP